MVDEVGAIIGKDYFINKNKERRLSELDQMNFVDRTISGLGGDPAEIKSLGRRILSEEAGMIPGAVAGGRYGQALGPWGRVTGMALGGAAGALTGKKLDELFGNPRPDEQGLMDDFITAAGGTLAAKLPPVRKSEVRLIDNIFEGKKISRTPGMVSDSTIVQAMEQRLKELPGSAGQLDTALEKTYSQFENAINHLLDDSTLRIEGAFDIGKTIAKGAQSKIDAFKTRADALYKATKVIRGDSPVQPTELGEFVSKYSGRFDNPAFGELKDNLEMQKLLKALIDEDGNLVTQSWRDMDEVREIMGGMMQFGSGKDVGLMKKAYKSLLNDMDVAADQFGGPGKRAWKKARDYTRKTTFSRSEQLAKIAAAEPESLWRSLVAGKGSFTKIAKAKRAVDRDTWKNIVAEVIRYAGRDVDANSMHFFNPQKFLTAWSRISEDTKAAKVMFGDMYSDLKDLASIARRMKAPQRFGNSSGTGRANFLNNLFLVGAGGVGGVSGAVFSPIAGVTAAASTLLAPATLGKIWTSPKLIKWMKRGSDLQMNSPKVRTAYARAGAALMAAEGIDDEQISTIAEYIMGASPNMQSGPYDDVPTVPNQ